MECGDANDDESPIASLSSGRGGLACLAVSAVGAHPVSVNPERLASAEGALPNVNGRICTSARAAISPSTRSRPRQRTRRFRDFSRTTAWLVDAEQPDRSKILVGFEGHSVHYIFRIAARNLVLIGHCCGLYCYGENGLLWSLQDLFCCKDPVLDVAGNDLVILAHKHGEDPNETPKRKIVDLWTGRRLA